MRKYAYLLMALAVPSILHPYTIASEQKEISPDKTELILKVNLNPGEKIDEKKITLTSTHPGAKLSKWKTDIDTQEHHDTHSKQKTKVFAEDFSLSTYVTKTTSDTIVPKIHVTLASNQSPKPQEETFSIRFGGSSTHASKERKSTQDSQVSSAKTAAPVATKKESKEGQTFMGLIKEYREHLKETLSHTNSWGLRILFAFLLGLLLSLTPCIYPMIPITVGVLQSQGSTSLFRNFLLSCCYALGLGTTFSIMGLLAASSGAAFGSIMVNPIFVVCIVSFLLYFAFSMFGFYNLYIPRFMQNKSSVGKSGSALSIFIFGLASGTVSSPCLSPGLALILTMVATMANKALGFLLLFAFGIGISTPLIVIGTFSGSMNMLPRAGTWMLEVQKAFGFMLIGMCFYYVNNIVPYYVTLGGLTIFFASIGYHYFSAATKATGTGKYVQNIVGVIALVITVFLAIETFQNTYYPEMSKDAFEKTWMTNYSDAVQKARSEGKMLFIDFWTPYCSICKAITATILKNPKVTQVLNDKYVILSVDAADGEVEPYKTLKSRYNVWGAPNLLVVNPNTGQELKRWQSEMYDMEIPDVIKDLNQYSKEGQAVDDSGLLGILP